MAPGVIAPFLPHRIRILRWGAWLWLGTGWLAVGSLQAAEVKTPPAAAPAPNSRAACLECHRDEKLQTKKAGRMVPLFVNEASFAKSVHRTLDCTDCHEGFDGESSPHKKPLTTVDCGSCHEKEAKQYATSIHGMSHAMGASGAATCTSCHGAHEIVPVNQIDSPVFKLNLPQTCATCHSNKSLTDEYRITNSHAAAQYVDSIHGRALLQMGLIVAPSCNNCHGVHDIKRNVDKDSRTNHANIAKTCGQCHVGIEEIYNQSVHGQLLAKHDPRGPVCSDCHTAHQIEKPTSAHFKALSDQRCGRCHEDRLTHYRETYHGKAMALGRPNVASDVAGCYDCHGHHDVFPVSDPRSRLSKEHILGTCQQCHPGVSAKFTTYQPHANPLDKVHYPLLNKVFLFMTALLVGTFGFFGVHTLFWLFRSIYLYLHDSKAFREAKTQVHSDDEQFTRFTPFERFLHLMVVTSFLLLVITGLVLSLPWGRYLRLPAPRTRITIHATLSLFTLVFVVLHLVVLALDPWAKVGWIGALLPFASEYRPLAVSLGVLALWAGIIAGVSARFAGHFMGRHWWPIHKVAAVTLVMVWAHSVFAGSDVTALTVFYIATGLFVVALAVTRYSARTPADLVDSLTESLEGDTRAPAASRSSR